MALSWLTMWGEQYFQIQSKVFMLTFRESCHTSLQKHFLNKTFTISSLRESLEYIKKKKTNQKTECSFWVSVASFLTAAQLRELNFCGGEPLMTTESSNTLCWESGSCITLQLKSPKNIARTFVEAHFTVWSVVFFLT